ncbi:MAG: dihydroorotase [Gemmatimonadota bacterium]|nr:MAG: dihydroorotase [Gemmatimonadota bacterium]
MSRPIVLRGGRVIDPSCRRDERLDVLLIDGRVAELGRDLPAPDGGEDIDVAGLVVAPGLVDLHVHLREPGDEHKETITSGARAAVAGGFTSICAMPNTRPPIDDPAAVGFVRAEGERAGYARVYPVGAVSIGLKGEEMTEIGELVAAGAIAVTDDGRPVWDSGLARRTMEYTRAFDIPFFSHSEDLGLSGAGVMYEGSVSTALGLRGIPNAAEDVAVARECMIAELTGGQLHVLHVSTRGSVEVIRAAKARGVWVSAEVTPHHLALTDEAVRGYRTEAKMNPPLRSAADVQAVRDALVAGVIDCIATDHAPHHYEDKEREFDDAPFGVIGLETALGVSMRELVVGGRLDLIELIDRLSTRPARIARLPAGTLVEGSPADVVVIDPDERWVCDASRFLSLSRNTPFAGEELVGRVVMTLVGGRVVYDRRDDRKAAREGVEVT